ncbi:MAG: hypothetical protein KA436_06625 [Oligoflexales bacterium]|nr:hypothetical protein [Oligoflexales bacterium]
MANLDFRIVLPFLLGLSCLLLWGTWIKAYGLGRSSAAILCRLLWILPLVLAFFPALKIEELPSSLQLSPIHILIDDSSSMKKWGTASAKDSSDSVLMEMKNYCHGIGCVLKTKLLSEIDPSVKQGLSPLRSALPLWFGELGDEPWILMSDGGDSQPMIPWPESLKARGKQNERKVSSGLILGFGNEPKENIWIENLYVPTFSFEQKRINVDLSVGRRRKNLSYEKIQVQVSLAGQVLSAVNSVFDEGTKKMNVSLVIPSLPKGQHLLTVQALPSPGEEAIWDNTVYASSEVLSNTLGVLHILGSPSWDGRFLRRYLKSEPKYDLVSFFILRDPWDEQQGNERELSLIPFPVARLFQEELAHFRLIILQNFNLLQFLQPDYQRNLVRFVKSGGSLLFVGGSRALLNEDILNSPLREILPFELKKGDGEAAQGDPLAQHYLMNSRPFMQTGFQNPEPSKIGPWFDKGLEFKIKMAEPSSSEKELATVYDDWMNLAAFWDKFPTFRGLHHMENVLFKKEESTPLLAAESKAGQLSPLAVASYPGKGRAIWLFSDHLWSMALNPREDLSRDIYYRFMESAFAWLLRSDLKQALSVESFQIAYNASSSQWQARVQGAALRYLTSSADWVLKVCDIPFTPDKVGLESLGYNEYLITGSISSEYVRDRKVCAFEIEGLHKAFGSVKVSKTSPVYRVLKDAEVGASFLKLKELATLTEAPLLMMNPDADLDHLSEAITLKGNPKQILEDWLAEHSSQNGVSTPGRRLESEDPYWLLDRWWIWLLLLFLPLEVIARRGTAIKR